VLDTLRDLKIAERTLVVFTSDNGPWLIKGADGGSAGPLRGGKGSTWEGGGRVPTPAGWPGNLPVQRPVRDPPPGLGPAGGLGKSQLARRT